MGLTRWQEKGEKEEGEEEEEAITGKNGLVERERERSKN